MRILLVEDNLRLAALVQKSLEKESFAVDAFGTVAEGKTAVATVSYAAVILDLGLPDGDGLEVLKFIRGKKIPAPVMILTARDGIDDRVRGLDAGADDYLLKPFATEELAARLRALLRRPEGGSTVKLEVGNVVFDTTRHELSIDGKITHISPREMSVLEQLMRRAGGVVAKDTIENSLYGFNESVTPNSVEAIVSRLRKRLGSAGAAVSIHTLRGVGYLISGEQEQ